MSEHKDPVRVAAGLKAAMHNPHVSAEAKEHATERLEQMTHETGKGPSHARNQEELRPGEQHDQRVLGGYKATLHSERTSPEAKKHAREILEAAGVHAERPHDVSEDEHQRRVLGGYKAALNNPRVSADAKDHARAYLEEHHAL